MNQPYTKSALFKCLSYSGKFKCLLNSAKAPCLIAHAMP